MALLWTKDFGKNIQAAQTTDNNGNSVGIINIHGFIDWYKFEPNDDYNIESTTAYEVKKALESFNNITRIEMSINSEGGDVKEGLDMFNLIDDYKSKHSIKVNGTIDYAASMATVVSMVCDYITIRENAVYMIHKPSMFFYGSGNATRLREIADVLDVYENSLIACYMRHFKGTEDELKELLEAETFMKPKDVKKYGLADKIKENIKMVACADGRIRIGNEYYNEEIREKLMTANMKYQFIDIKTEESEGEIVEFKYDESLAQYGITQEIFNTFTPENFAANFVQTITDYVVMYKRREI